MPDLDRARRQWLATAAGGIAAACWPASRAAAAEALAPTLAMFAGPFYPDTLPLDRDNDLTRVDGQGSAARGTVLDLTGIVVDRRGRAVPQVHLEIWQCDAGGHYHHVGGAEHALDPGFQGYGSTVSAADGAWRFRTIRPVPYSGRTPHIHFKLRGAGFSGLTTQMFVKDDPGNAEDWIYRALAADRRAGLEVALVDGGDGALRGHFRIVLDADGRFERGSPTA